MINADNVCRGCPGVLLGDCETCSRNENGDELTDREREEDYRELCTDVERDDSAGESK